MAHLIGCYSLVPDLLPVNLCTLFTASGSIQTQYTAAHRYICTCLIAVQQKRIKHM